MCADAETLFLVDDDEPELWHFTSFDKHAVRADKYVDLAFLGCLGNGLLFLCRAKTREQVDLDRETRRNAS